MTMLKITKSKLFVPYLIFISIIISSSCNNKDSNNNISPATDYYFEADVNGITWKAQHKEALYYTSNNTYTIDALDSDNKCGITKNINFHLPIDATSVGTYTIYYGLYTICDENESEGWSSNNSGTCTVTEIKNNIISGTFYLTVNNNIANPKTVVITNGKFRCPISN